MTTAHVQPLVQTPSQQLAEKIPGYVYRHRKTGELLGVVSCDNGHWLEVMDQFGYVSERHVRGLTNAYERVVKGTLRATREVVIDHGGEFAAERVRWSCERGELLAVMRGVAEGVAA